MMYGNNMGTGDWIFSVLGTLIIIGLIVGVSVWAVSRRNKSVGYATAGGSAREILGRRLANGEITAEQYQQLRETLDHATPMTSDHRPTASAGART